MKKKAKASKARKITTDGLRKFNLAAALLMAVQAVVILAIADPNKGLQAVSTNFLGLDKLASTANNEVFVPATRHLFDINIAYIVAAFFFFSAVAHLVVATRQRKYYETGLKEGVNRLRWIEYSLSASTMMIAVALLGGIYDISSLILIFTLTVILSLSGLLMELRYKGLQIPGWVTTKIGLLAGLVPWVVFAVYLWASQVYGSGVPNFVYWIYGSMLVLFSCFALNMYFQFKKKGNWGNYLFVERNYIILGLVTKAVLAWQIFAGALRS